MTTPVPVTKPTKTWIAAVGGVLSVAVPLITSLLTYLPPEWSAVITGAIGLLTVLGVYSVPNKPTGEVVVPAARPDGVPGVTGTVLDGGIVGARPPLVVPGEYKNPWA